MALGVIGLKHLEMPPHYVPAIGLKCHLLKLYPFFLAIFTRGQRKDLETVNIDVLAADM